MNSKKEEIELTDEMIALFKEALEKNQIQTVTTKKSYYRDLFIIPACSDELAKSTSICCLNLRFNLNDETSANNLYAKTSKQADEQMRAIAQYLTQVLNLTGKDEPLVLTNDAHPSAEGFYSLPYYRVAIRAKFMNDLGIICTYDNNEEDQLNITP